MTANRSSFPLWVLAVLSVAGGALGFAVGRFGGANAIRGATPAGDAVANGKPLVSQGAAELSRPAVRTFREPVRLPEANFSDRAGLNAFVAELQRTGLDEQFAKWLAISAKVQDDLPASRALAKEANLEREWAVAVALTAPETGFDLVRTLRGRDIMGAFGPAGALGSFFETLGRTSPDLGAALLGRLSSFEAMNVAPAFFGSWAERSSEAAMEAASRLEPRGMREHALLGLFREWGARDRRGMLAWASAQSSRMGRVAFRSQFEMSSVRNPAELLKLAREFPSAAEPWVLVNAAGELAGQGAAGWKAIDDFPPGSRRNSMISWFASRWAEIDPKGAWDLAKSLSPEDRKVFLNWSVTRELAKVAPAEIAEIIRDGDYGEISGVSDVISTWAGIDPRAAFEWSLRNLDGRKRSDSLGRVLSGWAAADPPAAVQAVNALPPGMRAKLLPDMVSAWGQSDPQAAFGFAKALPEIDRVRATAGVIRGWAYADPISAAEALGSVAAEGMGIAYDVVSSRLAEKDPGFAMDWAGGIGSAEMCNRAARQIVENWARKDGAAASDRLVELKPGEFRDHAVVGFVESIRALDPMTAAEWADSIGQPEMRRSNLQGVLQFWKTKDRAAARQFAERVKSEPLRVEMLRLMDE